MDKLTIDQNDLAKPLGIDMGPKISPLFKDCPKCHQPLTYLGPMECPYCGESVEFIRKPLMDFAGKK